MRNSKLSDIELRKLYMRKLSFAIIYKRKGSGMETKEEMKQASKQEDRQEKKLDHKHVNEQRNGQENKQDNNQVSRQENQSDNKSEKVYRLKKADIALIVSCVVVLVVAVLVVSVMFSGKRGETAIVSIDGDVILIQDLKLDCAIPVMTKDGYNLFVVQNGTAYIEEANCPNQDCVQHAPVSKKGESIVCLPHKLTVEIE